MSTACTSDQRQAQQGAGDVGVRVEQAAAASAVAAPLAGTTLTKDTPPPARTEAPVGRAYLRLVVVLGLLIAIGPLTIDMYLPALPTLSAELGATQPQAQLTLTGIMIGLGLGQLVLGPLSDALGRRRVLLGGLVVHASMSVLCAIAPSIEVLTAVRVGQGVAGAAIAVVAMAAVRDLYSGRKAATLLSHLTLVLGAAPILAPTMGGYLLAVTSWRGIFVVLFAIAVALVALAFFGLPETLPVSRRRPLALRLDPGHLPRPAARPPVRGPGARRRPDVLGAVQLRVGLLVRLPGVLRPGRAAVRPGLRPQRGRPDRGHAGQPVPAAPVLAAAGPQRGAGRGHLRHHRPGVGGRRRRRRSGCC